MDNRYLAAGGVGALVVGAVAAAFFFLAPQPAQTQPASAPEGSRAAALAIAPDEAGIGDPNAPIKLIEYASAGCGHCAAFHIQTMPDIKKNWIDKGLVYYVLRDFPLDGAAATASLIARCLPNERFYPFMDVIFRNQPAWHSPTVPDIREALIELSRHAGLSREQVEACLKDQAKLDKMVKGRDDAEKILHVNSTPTMFVNGEMMQGAATYSEFEAKFKALQPEAAQP